MSDQRYKVGDKVWKLSDGEQTAWKVVAVFPKLDGETRRYVVEGVVEHGNLKMLHVASDSVLKRRKAFVFAGDDRE